MENKTVEEVPEVTSPPQRWKILLRQNSEKIGTFAEDVVLPKSQRSGVQRSANVELRDVEAQGTYAPSATTSNALQRQPKAFPIFMIGISLVQVALMYKVDSLNLLLVCGYDPHRRHELWRFFTIMLVHTGLSHLWSNMFLQLILGVLLEIVHHWKRILIIYLASILGGSLFITVLSPQAYAVGASAGVYGLLFSHLSTIILNWNEMDRKCCRLFWLLFYILFDVGLSFYLELAGSKDNNTSHAGHFGGAVTGFLISILVLKNFEKHPWEKKMQKICVGILIVLCILIFLINVTAWGLYRETELNFDYESTYEDYIFELLIESPDESPIRKLCREDAECKLTLDIYNFNGTIRTT